MTAISSDGTELPEYLGFNETTNQIYGYTQKEGLTPTTISVVADDGTSQVTSNFVVTASDSNSKSDAGMFTEKSLAALMWIETSSVGGIATNNPVSQSTGSLQPLAKAKNATNLTSFQINNPSIDGSGTTIAVLDTGIDLDHPFFGGDANRDGISDKIVASQDFHGDGNGASDPDGDGTHVSGIAMSSDTSLPGVAQGANVAAIQVLGANGGFTSSVEAGLQWVIINASALNITSVKLSLGDENNSNIEAAAGLISDELAALRSMGIITFAAVGNSFAIFDALGLGDPAIEPDALAISASDSANEGAASYSQRSETLTALFAPGTFITNAAPGAGPATQTLSGTSMSSPYVAGVSSLMCQLKPNLSVNDFETFLTRSASTFSDPTTEGTYRVVDVDALASLVAGSPSSALTTPSSTPPPSSDDHPNLLGNNTNVLVGMAVTGELETGGDKDVFSLSVEAGAIYQIDLRGSPSSLGTLSDPLVRIIDANGTTLVQDDDSGTGLESKLEYTATSSGTLSIEAGGFSSRQTGTYQIDVANVSGGDDQTNGIGNNASLTIGSAQTGNIEDAGDIDVFLFL